MKKHVEFMGSNIDLSVKLAVSTTLYHVYRKDLTDFLYDEVRISDAEYKRTGTPGMRFLRKDIEVLHEVTVLVNDAPFKKELIRTEKLKNRVSELIQAAEDSVTQTLPATAAKSVLTSLGFK